MEKQNIARLHEGGQPGRTLVDVVVGGSAITLDATSAYTPMAAAFNGFDIRDVSTGTPITGASLDPSSGPLPAGDLTFGAHDVYVNLQNVALDPASPVIVDVATSVPEPASWVMMLIGFVALGGVARAGARRTAQITGQITG